MEISTQKSEQNKLFKFFKPLYSRYKQTKPAKILLEDRIGWYLTKNTIHVVQNGNFLFST